MAVASWLRDNPRSGLMPRQLPVEGIDTKWIAGRYRVLKALLHPGLAEGDLRADASSDPDDSPEEIKLTALGLRPRPHYVRLTVLDAQLRASVVSFKDYLGVTVDRVPSGVTIPPMDSISHLLDTVGRCVADGYQRVKLEIHPGWDLEPVRAVRADHPDLDLQVDGCSAYSSAAADVLTRLDAFGLLFVEQPFETDALRHHALLAQRIDTPVCLGNSILSATSGEDVMLWGAAAVIKVTPANVGGYLEAMRLHDVAIEHGVPAWCGGSWESGLGRAATVALAGLPGFTLTGDISGFSPFGQYDIADPCERVDGHVLIPDVPGLAPPPRRQRLAELTVSTVRIRFS